MGEVYRATDTKLGRDAAIKVLPEEFTSHPDSLERFEREAMALAALNHPNVATVHGFEHDAELDVHFLVMEHIDGETLGDRIAVSALPVRDAVPIFIEIAQGLDGIYLVLHGAMACRSFLDPEGEIVDRIRRLPGGAEIPICGVLDLHGNISRSTIEQTQGLIAYRCNPHTDAREAAVRGAQLLDRILSDGKQPISVWEQPPRRA